MDFASSVDDNTPDFIVDDVIQVVESLKEASDGLFILFPNNPMKANSDKSSIIRQKGKSQNECFKKAKYATITEKQTFLTS